MSLIKNQNFNIALLISATCHFVSVLCISPVLPSLNIRENQTVISFIGSMLERVSVASDRSIDKDVLDFDRHVHALTLKWFGFDQNAFVSKRGGDIVYHKAEKIEYTLGGEVDKKITPGLGLDVRRRGYFEFSDILVAGAVKNRIVLYKPPLPEIRRLDSEFSFSREVIIRFKVSRHGFIELPECILSSGDPEIDKAALRYVRRWQFVPITDDTGSLEDGLVRFRFD